MSVLADVLARRVIPVVTLEAVSDAEPLAGALVAGGLPVAEVTFRTPASVEALRVMSGRLLAGVGTVVNAAQVDVAVDAGARFVVSPGLSAAVVRRCAERDVPVIPGVATASELMAALELGSSSPRPPRAGSPRCGHWRHHSPAYGSSRRAASGPMTSLATWRIRPWSRSVAAGWSRRH